MAASNKNRRLILGVYRNLMRWCSDIPPGIPLDEFIPPMRVKTMDDVDVFRSVLREEFREALTVEETLVERIEGALQGLRQLHEIHPEVMAYSRQWGDSILRKKMLDQEQQKSLTKSIPTETTTAMDEREWVQQKIDAVRWLPNIEESPPQSLDVEDSENTVFPLFSLQSPLFHSDVLLTDQETKEENNSSMPLPLFSPQSDIPVPGMEAPLKIFEPRYRQLYSDLREKPARLRNLVVPFCHPMTEGQFSQYGLVYQLTQIQEVADETSGKIQYLTNHVVTKPIQLLRVLNPQVWATKETYLQVQGRLMDDRADMDHSVYEALEKMLAEWKQETSHPLATKSVNALKGEGFWTLVSVWNSHFQQELIQLQLGIATQIKEKEKLSNLVADKNLLASLKVLQQPHRPRLLQLLLDTRLLVPTLLSLDGPGKCQHMIHAIEQERKRK